MATFNQWQQSTCMSIVYSLDDGLALPDPALDRFEDPLRSLYYALVDAMTPPEPREIAHRCEIADFMRQIGALRNWRDLNRSVQRYRDRARAGAVDELRAALLSIERKRAGQPAQELAEVA